jgi:hypothetical protein
LDLDEEADPVLDGEVLQEVLGECGAAVGEVESLSHIHHHIYRGEWLDIDVHPSRQRLTAAPDMEEEGSAAIGLALPEKEPPRRAHDCS